jgi:hypothetical protein
VLVNSNHLVRSLMFDNSNYVFYNHSSILNQVTSANENMLRIHSLRDNYHQSVLDNFYDKRRV